MVRPIKGQGETIKREIRESKTLDTDAKFLFKIGIEDFTVKLKTTG